MFYIDSFSTLKCKNEHEWCIGWARIGECKKSPRYMQSHCKRACNVCGNNISKFITSCSYYFTCRLLSTNLGNHFCTDIIYPSQIIYITGTDNEVKLTTKPTTMEPPTKPTTYSPKPTTARPKIPPPVTSPPGELSMN